MLNNDKDIEKFIKNLDLPEPSKQLESRIMAITKHEQEQPNPQGLISRLKGYFATPAMLIKPAGFAMAACLTLVIALNFGGNSVQPASKPSAAPNAKEQIAYDYFSPVLEEMFPDEYYSELEPTNIFEKQLEEEFMPTNILDEEIDIFLPEEYGKSAVTIIS